MNRVEVAVGARLDHQPLDGHVERDRVDFVTLVDILVESLF